MPSRLMPRPHRLAHHRLYGTMTFWPPSVRRCTGINGSTCAIIRGTERIQNAISTPYGIVFNVGYWYTAGYCHARHDLRTFRLDRITALELHDQTFERPADFDLLGYVLNSIASWPGTEQIEVLLRTSLEHAQQIISPIMGTLEPTVDGVIFRRAANQLEWIAHVLLNLDFPVHVVQTPELRRILRQIAAKAIQMAGEDG